MKTHMVLILAFLTLSPYVVKAETDALAECIKNSPYVNKQTARNECLRVTPELESIPERFMREDAELARQNEEAKQRTMDAIEDALYPKIIIDDGE